MKRSETHVTTKCRETPSQLKAPPSLAVGIRYSRPYLYLLPAVLVMLCCVSIHPASSGEDEPPPATKLTVELPPTAVPAIVEAVVAAGGRVLREPAPRPASARLFSECVDSAVACVGGAGGADALFVERVVVRTGAAMVTVRGSSAVLLDAFYDMLRTSAGLGLRRGTWRQKRGDVLEGHSERTDKIGVTWEDLTLGRFLDALPAKEWSYEDVKRAFSVSEAYVQVQRAGTVHKVEHLASNEKGVRRIAYLTSYEGISTRLLHAVLNNLELKLGGAGVVTGIGLRPADSERVDGGKRLMNAQIRYVITNRPR